MKKFKNISITFLILISLGVLNSCESVLEVEPESSISDEQFWKTNEDAKLGLAAAYDALQKAYRTKRFYWGEFRADNYVNSEKPQPDTQDLINNNLTPESSTEYLQWDEFYSLIFRANLAIEKIPEIPYYDTQYLGEAYALRAFAYFDAYRVWGGVPLFTKAELTFSDDAIKPRSSAQEVLDLVLSDIEEAEKNLTVVSSDYTFSKLSLLAFKAQVHMYLNEYEAANTALTSLIASNQFSLTTNRKQWRDLFLNDEINYPGEGQEGPELIMSIRYDFEEDGNRASGIYQVFFPGVPSYYVAPNLVEEWETKFPTDSTAWATKYPNVPPHVFEENEDTGELNAKYGDYRYYESIAAPGTQEEDLRISKYHKVNISPSIDDTNIILFRYADMLLLKAEALNQLGQPTEAIELVNQIREARELPLVNSGTIPDVVNINDKDELEDFILSERRLELLAEGYRWWDLVRTNKAVEVMGPINGLTQDRIIWPLWFRHLIDNPKLEQNVPY
ncbi:SusD-like protein [Formosa agariphila KMM 3901]|uniref:SusD-like protein P38 n=1 Tax=Formosa agariphila (strain DSM 15362 / KCTC 12365 / LMG 23005 / KMM 3901 / M-2Alg 35-1) TaxID=1347342 RepID=PLH38_FORAG|nr:RagB/SusD family nutrient uptake outer membrane protein [Formosa agariphila]T2KPM5.1 RecName: Full=SusD-like protein P38; Short=P38_SusD; AltName: Full=Polysaccharide utilization locus H protein P38; Short=PUL H protein P38; Flags: Precursor [Formosa agariphila KMM 3901]CDF79939.1 SusD-like protein [Formosa agariphila KMM 3901]